MNTPLRRLQGVSYWVIEDPKSISEYVNTNVKREWEMDICEAGGTEDDEL